MSAGVCMHKQSRNLQLSLKLARFA